MALPSFYISHGGGPWPYMVGPMLDAHALLEAALREMPRQLGREPKAVLMVSGHWEEAEFTVMSSAHPPMLYDYDGFPEHTYRVEYKAPGSLALAAEVQALAQSAGLVCRSDGQRGFDHGAFVPLEVIYPEARVPVVQLSLRRDFDPGRHLALGRAPAPLRREDRLCARLVRTWHFAAALPGRPSMAIEPGSVAYGPSCSQKKSLAASTTRRGPMADFSSEQNSRSRCGPLQKLESC